MFVEGTPERSVNLPAAMCMMFPDKVSVPAYEPNSALLGIDPGNVFNGTASLQSHRLGTSAFAQVIAPLIAQALALPIYSDT